MLREASVARREGASYGRLMAETKATVRIETHNRWDALDLAHELSRWRWYLVSRDGDRWDVVVRHEPRRATRQLMDAVQKWATRRELDSVVHLADADVAVHPRRRVASR